MLSIIHNDLKIVFNWVEQKNIYNHEQLLVNNELVTPLRISNKEKNGIKHFIIQLTNFYFTVSNNTVYGVHSLHGSFSGYLNEDILFDKDVFNDELKTCGYV